MLRNVCHVKHNVEQPEYTPALVKNDMFKKNLIFVLAKKIDFLIQYLKFLRWIHHHYISISLNGLCFRMANERHSHDFIEIIETNVG